MEFINTNEKALHGTTTVGLLAKDAVILAADRRATAGTFIAHKRTRKILRVGDKMALTTAGLVADAQVLADFLNVELRYLTITRKQPVSVREAAHLLSLILYRYKAFPFYVQLILGGYDSSPRLFSLDLFGSVLEEKYAATGSGSPIAMGVLEEGYREGLEPEEARKLAVRAVQMALRRDSATGDGVDSVIISREGIKEFSDPVLP
ncbi:MAG: archaeal proteasome endopeptidase complex subunit beta [Fervidicoccaceae archaeon]|jgi:proteasome beta subunit|uniref:Proteasome subunit beta n=1 Tax=Fervidicoccus fontis TaxID=683846 RepID=A0A7C2UKZ9_9CREN|nr:archaeal proteasome endopeptidase complex subunit beta [Fervidicoccus fontis]